MQSETSSETTSDSQKTTSTQILEQANSFRMLVAYKTMATRPRIEKWLSHVSDQTCLPLGEFPHRKPNRTFFNKIRTLQQFGPVNGRYLLEFEEEGAYYVETESVGMPRMQAYPDRSAVSEQWEESRGDAGEGGW